MFRRRDRTFFSCLAYISKRHPLFNATNRFDDAHVRHDFLFIRKNRNKYPYH